MQESNLEVSKQENSACDSNIIEGELSHLVFDVENPATEHRQKHPLDECGDGGGRKKALPHPATAKAHPHALLLSGKIISHVELFMMPQPDWFWVRPSV